MASFTTRVELHKATAADYAALHQAMEAKGFSRTISSDDGVQYHLPTAEYNRSGTISIEQVRADAVTAAKSTGKTHSVFVSETTCRVWVGLDKVEPKAPNED